MQNDGSEYATRDWVELMISTTVTAPLARIEADLQTIKAKQSSDDAAARESRSDRRDWLAPVLAAVVTALLTWALAIGSHKGGIF